MNAPSNPQLDDIASELALREPLFHRAEFGTTRQDFDRMMADEFWEVGASGQIYSRSFVLDTLEVRSQQPVGENFQVTNFACQQVAADLFLATYTLNQSGRISRRASLWRQASDGWRVVYHQGTIVTDGP